MRMALLIVGDCPYLMADRELLIFTHHTNYQKDWTPAMLSSVTSHPLLLSYSNAINIILYLIGLEKNNKPNQI